MNKQVNYKYSNENGITLVAMILIAVAMLVLAGVSMKAIIIDKTTITNSSSNDVKIGIELLEEYLEQEYKEKCDDISEDKLTAMLNDSELSKYFQKNSEDEYSFLDNADNKYYFIEKSALPKDIQNCLIGGDTSLTGKTTNANFNDIYGITKDLKVCYFANGYDSLIKLNSSTAVLDIKIEQFSS